jgi:RHS repeat-associated protein
MKYTVWLGVLGVWLNAGVWSTRGGMSHEGVPQLTTVNAGTLGARSAQNQVSPPDNTIHAVNVVFPNSIALQYDGNGNLTNDGSRSFVYDDENQLISVSLTNSAGILIRSDFSYDGLMRRRIRVEMSWSGSSWTTNQIVRYVYDGAVVVQERDGNNIPRVTYTRGLDLAGSLSGAGGIGGLLARTDNSSYAVQAGVAHAYYHADGMGNITCMVNSNQAVVAKYLYDGFGSQLAKSGQLADANAYRASSQEYFSTSGLVGYSRRFYDSNLQRWLNRDPLGEAGGLNLYNFVGNNSINILDPFGLDPSLGALFVQNVLHNGFSDYLRFGSRLGQDALNQALSLTKDNLMMMYDPLDFAIDKYHAVADAAVTAERLVDDPCERQRALKALGNHLLTPEGSADVTAAALSFIAAGFVDPEAAAETADEGIIYLRTSANGGEYVGQAESAARYAERQLEHAAKHPTESFTFQELERVPANSGRSLNVAEEDWIRAGGGPKSTGGRLENARHQMNDVDYRKAGGNIPYP